MTKKQDTRQYWGKIEKKLPELNLLSIQKESYKWFISEGVKEVIDEISPIEDFTGKNWEISSKGLTYFSPLTVEATLVNKKTGKRIAQHVFLGEIPKMPDRGTFIVNGIERVIVSQIVR